MTEKIDRRDEQRREEIHLGKRFPPIDERFCRSFRRKSARFCEETSHDECRRSAAWRRTTDSELRSLENILRENFLRRYFSDIRSAPERSGRTNHCNDSPVDSSRPSRLNT